MDEELKKAEVESPIWPFLVIIIGVSSMFISAFIIGHGSFDFLSTPIPISSPFIILLGVMLYVIWRSGNRAILQPDWKTLATGRRAMFSFKTSDWNICTFQGLGSKRQDYLNRVTEEMEKRDFQLTDKSPAINIKGSDLIFKHPKGPFFCIRAVSIGENLRVGFKSTEEMGREIFPAMFLAALPTFLSIYIIGGGVVPWTNVPKWMASIPLIIFFTFFIGTFGLMYRLSLLRKFRQEIKPLLVGIGKSSGSKQVTPFRKILAKYK